MRHKRAISVMFRTTMVAAITAVALAISSVPAHAASQSWPNGRTCDSSRTVQVHSRAAGDHNTNVYHIWIVGGTTRDQIWSSDVLRNRYSLTYHRIATYGQVGAAVIAEAYLNCVQ